jgi:hypothetical protein
MDLNKLFEKLWNQYTDLNPQAFQVHELLETEESKILNDHVAFRTYNDPKVNIEKLARVFVENGYKEAGSYEFTQKKLIAKHFEHPDHEKPKVFISELLLDEFSKDLQENVSKLLDEMPQNLPEKDEFCLSGRPWSLQFSTYEKLLQESEYAAWLAAFGFCANHFTVSVNDLEKFSSLSELNEFLKGAGFELNKAGGEIKGSPKDFLEQSSTLASRIHVDFDDGRYEIPACYYEFAKRYPMENGELFQGFVAKSADKIFESTDRRW